MPPTDPAPDAAPSPPPPSPPAPGPPADRAALEAERNRLLAVIRRGEGSPEIGSRIHAIALRLAGH